MKLRTLLLAVGLVLAPLAAPAAEPQVYFSRSDKVAGVILREIDAAQKSIHVLIYSLTDDDIAEALIRAAARGVDVKIVMYRTQAAGKQALDEILLAKLGP